MVWVYDVTNNKGKVYWSDKYLDIRLTRFLKCMQQIKCKYVITAFHCWKIRYILSLLECAVYSKWNQITKCCLENTFYKPLLCLYIHIRGVHFICVQKEYSQYDSSPGSQAAQTQEGQARECISLWCCFWTEAWAGPWTACATTAPEESVLWQIAFYPSQGQPWRNRGERELLNGIGCYLLASRNGFCLEIIYHFLWSIDKWPKAKRRLWM